MEVGDVITIKIKLHEYGHAYKEKIYKILQILPRENVRFDLIICESVYGYRECFQRQDIVKYENPIRRNVRGGNYKW